MEKGRADFNVEFPAVASMTDAEVEEYRRLREITVEGRDIPKPVKSFRDVGFPDYVLEEIKKAGLTEPTSIQSQGWPIALRGRDLIGIGETGSGKILTYLLPAIVHVNAQPILAPGDGPIVLILVTTRELAVQIQQEVSKFGSSSKIKTTCLYGGVQKRPQVRHLKKGVEIVIATPERLKDMMDSNNINVQRVTYLVLDEVDRMLDMGFGPQIRKIASHIRPDRQTLYWSPTWPKEVEQLSTLFLYKPYKVIVGSPQLNSNRQIVDVIYEWQKYGRLLKLLKDIVDGSRTLVFFDTEEGCDQITHQLCIDGWTALSIHGGNRDWVLFEFRSGNSPIMTATDAATRDLDVKDVMYVINYDFPGSLEDYVDRIGRMGDKGTTYTFFTLANARFAKELINILEEAGQKVSTELTSLVPNTAPSPPGGCSMTRTPSNMTAVWWDINKCPVPPDYDPRCVRPSIESALMKSFGSGPVLIYAMGNIKLLSRSMRKRISMSGIFLRHTESGLVGFLDDFHQWIRDHAPPARMMLLSDDHHSHDYSAHFDNFGYEFIPAGKDWFWKDLLQKDIPFETSEDTLEKETGEVPWFCTICEFASFGYADFASHLEGSEHAEEVKWRNAEMPPGESEFSESEFHESDLPNFDLGIDLPYLDSGIDYGIDSVLDSDKLDSMLREGSLWRMQNLV